MESAFVFSGVLDSYQNGDGSYILSCGTAKGETVYIVLKNISYLRQFANTLNKHIETEENKIKAEKEANKKFISDVESEIVRQFGQEELDKIKSNEFFESNIFSFKYEEQYIDPAQNAAAVVGYYRLLEDQQRMRGNNA